MLRIKRRLSSLLVVVMMICLVWLNINYCAIAVGETTTFYPTEFNGVLNNPYTGWVPGASGGPYPQPHSMVFAGITWRELEPTKGNFDWNGIENKYKFSYWKSKGIKINLRFIMDLPGAAGHKDIPDWLYNETGGSGTWYNTSEIGAGFSPDYSNTSLIVTHQRVINALAMRYNNDPGIAFIQLGSLGHWAEWHTWPYLPSTGVFPPTDISNQYVQHYINAFTNKIITMRRSTQIASDSHFGLFNDMFGDTASFDSNGWGWMWQIKNGYTDDIGQVQPAMPNFWQYGPSGGEFANGDAKQYVGSSTVEETLRQVREAHTSWLGPCSPADLLIGSAEQTNLDTMLKTMGYRFVLESISHPASVNAGSSLPITMNWNNKGVAPFYYQWPMELSLANESGNIVARMITSEDIRKWLPGKRTVSLGMEIPKTLQSGNYTLCVGIMEPSVENSYIKLAIEGNRTDGRYALSKVVVNSTIPTSTPSPTPQTKHQIAGYVRPDFLFTDNKLYEGFKVETLENGMFTTTNDSGYFEISNLENSISGYTVKISKLGYLERTIANVPGDSDLLLGSQTQMVDLWPGDLVIDNVINMIDIMELAKGFNVVLGDPQYNPISDINLDGAVNMADVMIIVRHFNKTSTDYPKIDILSVE